MGSNLSNRYLEIKSRHKINNEDFKPFIIDQVFTEQELSDLYEMIDKSKESDTKVMKPWGQRLWLTRLPESVLKRLTEVSKAHISEDLEIFEATFARYSLSNGPTVKLHPHHDSARPSETVVLDIQINNSGEEWGIVIEGEKYYLKNNQGIVFYSTQQVHWREKKKFVIGEEVDMIFANFTFNPPKKFQPEWQEAMRLRALTLQEEMKYLS
jgi:hypothetical protein